MWVFLSTLALVAFGVYVVERLADPVLEWLTHVPEDVRYESPDNEDMTIPEDLLAFAMRQSEPWAREDMLGSMVEQRKLLGSWDRVRTAFGGLTEVKE